MCVAGSGPVVCNRSKAISDTWPEYSGGYPYVGRSAHALLVMFDRRRGQPGTSRQWLGIAGVHNLQTGESAFRQRAGGGRHYAVTRTGEVLPGRTEGDCEGGSHSWAGPLRPVGAGDFF